MKVSGNSPHVPFSQINFCSANAPERLPRGETQVEKSYDISIFGLWILISILEWTLGFHQLSSNNQSFQWFTPPTWRRPFFFMMYIDNFWTITAPTRHMCHSRKLSRLEQCMSAPHGQALVVDPHSWAACSWKHDIVINLFLAKPFMMSKGQFANVCFTKGVEIKGQLLKYSCAA